jgi:large subunit ribosomal protein L4e
MTSRPTVSIISADGKTGEASHPLPNVFKAPIRPDIVQYALPAPDDNDKTTDN